MPYLIIPGRYAIDTSIFFVHWQKLFEVAKDVYGHIQVFLKDHQVVCVRMLLERIVDGLFVMLKEKQTD